MCCGVTEFGVFMAGVIRVSRYHEEMSTRSVAEGKGNVYEGGLGRRSSSAVSQDHYNATLAISS